MSAENAVSIKLKDKVLGVIASLVITLVGFLVFSYFSSFVTRAEYNKDKTIVEVMANDVSHIKKSVDKLEAKLIK